MNQMIYKGTGDNFVKARLDGDDIIDIEFLDEYSPYGIVFIQFETMGWCVLGADCTWLEWYGERYETRDDYKRLMRKVESCKIAELLGRM